MGSEMCIRDSFANGKVALTGGPELADQLEEHGYDAFVTKGA